MEDMMDTIIPNSKQLNADDLLGGKTMTIKISKVIVRKPETKKSEQLVTIHYEGDNDKPYLPCLSMRRVLVNVWGKDSSAYIGRSLTLYCDPTVTFGAVTTGGIRISHMSHIDAPKTMALTATRANRKPFTVKPLVIAKEKPKDKPVEKQADVSEEATKAAAEGTEALKLFWGKLTLAQQKTLDLPALKATAALFDPKEETIEGCSDESENVVPPI